MKKYYFLLLFCLIASTSFAQVGINTTTPEAQLEIKSSNQATPTNKDGLLIPKIDTFPAINPTVAQQGMLVYLTTPLGVNQPGFYYWNNPTAAWLPVKGNNGGTLDQAYDFGGTGLGKTITADSGAVLINGTDGFVSTGTLNSGAIAPSGSGVKMFWNPRKAAFRAGLVDITSWWDDVNVGLYSSAFGSSRASGEYSFAAGNSNSAIGESSVAFGNENLVNGYISTVFGNYNAVSGQIAFAAGYTNSVSGREGVAFGRFNDVQGLSAAAFGINDKALGMGSFACGVNNIANGNFSTTFGFTNRAESYGETVLGIGATNYSPSLNGDTQFRAANATDRLFVIGNAIDFNNNNNVDTTERSDALIVLKNGLTSLPSTTNAMITAADGKAVVTKEYLQTNTSGTLDQAYNFGGAGLGKTITADAGAVLINGTDGLVSTGTLNSGALAPNGAGVKMFWNPRKAAFRAGNINATQWDDANVGYYSAAFGENNKASGYASTAFGNSTNASSSSSTAFGSSSIASGLVSTAFGSNSIASGNGSTAFGGSTVASGTASTAFGLCTTASGFYSSSFGSNTIASDYASTAFGAITTASGAYSTAFGYDTTASGNYSTAFGSTTVSSGVLSTASGDNNTATSYGETVLGIGSTTYTPSPNGANQFRAANRTDRLFVIGNAIDANNNSAVDTAERSDAMVVLKNGNIGIGTSTPQEDLVVSGPAGRTVMRIANTSTTASTSGVALEFFRASNALTDWRIFTSGASLLFGRSADDFLNVNNLFEFDDNYFAPVTDNALSIGRSGVRWSLVYASNGTINTSDVRQKKNIQNLNYGLTDLMKLRPVSFEWKKDDGSGTKLGLIAQELQQVIPEVVRDWEWEEDEQGNRKKVEAPIMGVFYSDLIPVLIKSIQEQQVIIDQQKEENKVLKQQLESQSKTIETILNRLQILENK